MSENNPFGTPHNPFSVPETMGIAGQLEPGGRPLASRGLRFAGAFVDGLLTLPIVFGLAYVAQSGNMFNLESVEGQLMFSLAALPVSIGWYLLLHGMLLAKRGQTIGKMLCGTQVVDSTTNQLLPLIPLLLKRNVIIGLLSMIPFVGSFVGLIDALLIFRENRRCLHDDFAGTKVIMYQG